VSAYCKKDDASRESQGFSTVDSPLRQNARSPLAPDRLTLDDQAEATKNEERSRQMKGVGHNNHVPPVVAADNQPGVESVLERVARSIFDDNALIIDPLRYSHGPHDFSFAR